MALPTCQCISGRPPFDRLADIFCALSQIDLACVIPTLLSATIAADGETLTLVFDEDVTSDGSGFVVQTESDASTLTYVSGGGTPTLIFTISPLALAGETATLNYTAEEGNTASGECLLASFVDFPVTNNTGVQFTYVQPDGFAYLQPDGVSLYLQP